MGQFYEVRRLDSQHYYRLDQKQSYFDQAVEVARILNIKLTSRKWDGRRIHMCGFPLAHTDKYLKVLVQQNKRFVAMCDEFPRYTKQGVKEFDRRVTRVITPGTLIDEPFLNPYENNFLLAISTPEDTSSIAASHTAEMRIGLAWIDVSTGEFFSKPSTYDSLRDELARIGPRETVVNERLKTEKNHPISQALAEEENFVSYISHQDCTAARGAGRCPGGASIIEAIGSSQSDMMEDLSDKPTDRETSYSLQETAAIGLLTAFLNANLLEYMPKLALPNQESIEARMHIDSHTIKALEIREGAREEGIRGSLLSAIKRTVTSGGTRLLTRWLCEYPSIPLRIPLTPGQALRARP